MSIRMLVPANRGQKREGESCSNYRGTMIIDYVITFKGVVEARWRREEKQYFAFMPWMDITDNILSLRMLGK